MCTAPEKCNIYAKFCNERDPWEYNYKKIAHTMYDYNELFIYCDTDVELFT